MYINYATVCVILKKNIYICADIIKKLPYFKYILE